MVEDDKTDTTYVSQANNAQVLSDLKALDARFEGATVTGSPVYEASVVLSTIRAKTYSEMSGVIEMTTQLDNQGFIKSRYMLSATQPGGRRLLRQLDEVNSQNGTDVADWPFELNEVTNTV